jgi:hypothetical protein
MELLILNFIPASGDFDGNLIAEKYGPFHNAL